MKSQRGSASLARARSGSDESAESSEAAEYAIELSNLSHAFVKSERTLVPVLRDISLKVRKKEFVTLVGPSGCGKSTLLNIVSGLLQPTAGEVRILGSPLFGIRTDIGYMLSADALLPWRTVEKNVSLSLELATHTRHVDVPRIRKLLIDVGLAGFETYYPSALSHGMRQRVALARTFVREVPLFLMDEPFSALDAQTRVKVQDLFLSLRDQAGQAVLFITHDVAEAVALSDRVVVLTNRPASVESIYQIDLPRPRSVQQLMIEEPKFQNYMKLIWRDLESDQ